MMILTFEYPIIASLCGSNGGISADMKVKVFSQTNGHLFCLPPLIIVIEWVIYNPRRIILRNRPRSGIYIFVTCVLSDKMIKKIILRGQRGLYRTTGLDTSKIIFKKTIATMAVFAIYYWICFVHLYYREMF